MCGRLNQQLSIAEIRDAFGTKEADMEPISPGFNVPPTSHIYGVVGVAPRYIETFRWGLLPPWVKSVSPRYSMFNARADSVATKRSYQAAFRSRRNLIPAVGFYEWQRIEGSTQPFYIYRVDGTPLALAGLWEFNEVLGIGSSTIITTDANDFMDPVHHRMPVVLEPEDWEVWLDPNNKDIAALQGLLRPAADGVLTMHAVHPMVGDTRNNSAGVVAPF